MNSMLSSVLRVLYLAIQHFCCQCVIKIQFSLLEQRKLDHDRCRILISLGCLYASARLFIILSCSLRVINK